jgi:dTDP-glucose 4,6-dehydratase
MKILITGAAGFLGSHLCDRLITEGHFVIGLDNFVTGDPNNLSQLAKSPNFQFIKHDISQSITIPNKLDAILHFASPASPNVMSPYGYPNLSIQTMKAGALGTHNCLGLCKKHNARFLLASTSEVYGDPLEHPQKESYWGHVDPIGPRSMYDEAKRFAEAMTMTYHRVHNVDTRIARIFNTFGPRMRLDDGRVVPNLILQALKGKALTIYGDGLQTRSFCYVDDLIEGLYRLLLSDYHMPVNLGNDVETSIIDFAKLINDLTQNASGIQFLPKSRLGDDPQRRRPDLSLARHILDWKPSVSLGSGLTKTIDHFKDTLGLH